MRIDIVSDVICPWCFIGKRHLERALALLAEEGLTFEVGWRPYQLNPDMPAGGIPRDAYREAKFGTLARSKELDSQVTDAAKAAGLAFHLDRIKQTPNTIQAHRLIRLADAQGLQDALVERLFVAYFQQGADIGDADTLAILAADVGLAAPAGDDGLTEVVAEDAAARQAGLNGVPSFLMEGYFLFSGAMPAEAMASQFRKANAVLQSRAGIAA